MSNDENTVKRINNILDLDSAMHVTIDYKY